jgi:putative nucleotidyltransferase with HDIG domain
MTALGLLVLYLLLFGVVRAGSNTIKRQQEQLVGYTRDLEQSYTETIGSLAAAVDARDSTTEQHSKRVTEMAVNLGRWIGMSSDELRDLERGALLHDVGKIGVSDRVLNKPGKLNEAEWAEMRQHPVIGHEMLHNVSFLQAALPVVRHHHERWDGKGYPDRLRGEWIPRSARLFAVIDVYDALTSDRPYRAAMRSDQAMAVLREGSGSHFDPYMVDAFEKMLGAHQNLQDQVHDLLSRQAGLPLQASAG